MDKNSDVSTSDEWRVDRRTVVKAVGAAAGLSLVSLPSSAAAASTAGFNGSGYTPGSTADIEFVFNVVQLPGEEQPYRTVELAFARTSYIPPGVLLTATVNWGDGSVGTYSSETNSLKAQKTYATTGTYMVAVSGLNAGIGLKMRDSSVYPQHLTEVRSWSNIGSLEEGLYGCDRLTTVPNTLPPGVLSLYRAFTSCTVFNSPIDGWDTSKVTTMFEAFKYAEAFNQNIGTWNLSSCTTLAGMFYGATAFNNGGSGFINNWNTSAVTDMSGMFYDADSFNQPIGAWNVGAVTSMASMFSNAYSFNQPIGAWNVGAVIDMSNMFFRWATPAMAFDQDISGWNVSSVGSNKAGFVNSNPGGAAYYQPTWLASERPAGFPSFN